MANTDSSKRPLKKTNSIGFSLARAIRLGLLLTVEIAVTRAQAGETPRKTGTKPNAVASPASILSVRAQAESEATLVDIVLQGRATPTLGGEGKRLTLFLPNTLPGPQLAAQLASGGLVSRIALERPPAPAKETHLKFDLSAAATATLEAGPDAQTLRLRIVPAIRETLLPAVHATAKGVYDVDAFQADVATVLKSLARDSGTSILLTGAGGSKVTVTLRETGVEKAIDLLTKAAGLTYHRDGDTYLVGTAKEIEAAYPKAQAAPPPPAPAPVMKQAVYRCRHIIASELLASLQSLFEKEALKIGLGASAFSPHLDESATSAVTGVQASVLKGNTGTTGTGGGSGNGSANNVNARDVILFGEKALVERALELAQKLDVRRQQVKISVKITDISTDALREMGVRWDWSHYTLNETGANGIFFDKFNHAPISLDATLSALEQNNRAKLLAAPTLSLLDGERGFILIGQRLIYPKLVGYTQAQTPIFDKEEERVGIYLQVAVQTTSNGEITLTVYPQVSVVTGFLTINGASYPQISTREQQTTIRVKHGERIIVGGLIRDDEIKNVQGIPILSRIPFFGELFTYRKKTRTKSEVVIMITPQILKD